MMDWKRTLCWILLIVIAILSCFGIYRTSSKIIASETIRAKYRKLELEKLELGYPYHFHEEVIPICLIDDKGNMLTESVDLDNDNRVVQMKLSIQSVVYSNDHSEVISYTVPHECFNVGAELYYDSITDKYTYAIGDYYANLSLTKSQLDASCDKMTKSRNNFTSQMNMLSFKADSLKNEYEKYSKHIQWLVGPLY